MKAFIQYKSFKDNNSINSKSKEIFYILLIIYLQIVLKKRFKRIIRKKKYKNIWNALEYKKKLLMKIWIKITYK
jgi:hypothetical protein